MYKCVHTVKKTVIFVLIEPAKVLLPSLAPVDSHNLSKYKGSVIHFCKEEAVANDGNRAREKWKHVDRDLADSFVNEQRNVLGVLTTP